MAAIIRADELETGDVVVWTYDVDGEVERDAVVELSFERDGGEVVSVRVTFEDHDNRDVYRGFPYSMTISPDARLEIERS